jgi:imidazolonepropionase-like amidohydrolase
MKRLWPCVLSVVATVAISAQQPSAVVALFGARVIDGTGAAPIANATILVTNGRIERIGPTASLKVPAGAARIDVSGRTIIPGLVNAHGHLGHGDSTLPVYDRIIQQLQLYPKFGITTVYALGDDGVHSARVSEEINNGPLTRARLFVSGARATARTAEEARTTIAERHARRVNIIKTGIGLTSSRSRWS